MDAIQFQNIFDRTRKNSTEREAIKILVECFINDFMYRIARGRCVKNSFNELDREWRTLAEKPSNELNPDGFKNLLKKHSPEVFELIK